MNGPNCQECDANVRVLDECARCDKLLCEDCGVVAIGLDVPGERTLLCAQCEKREPALRKRTPIRFATNAKKKSAAPPPEEDDSSPSWYDFVQKISVRLIREQPFYGGLLLGMKKVSSAEAKKMVETACVFATKDMGVGLAVNEDFFKTLSLKEQEAVLIHECMHVINMHLMRSPEEFKDPHIANISMDLAINQFIKNLPADALTLDQFSFIRPPLKPEETAEYYYSRLMQESDKIKQKIQNGDLSDILDDHSKWGESGSPEGKVPRPLIEAAARQVIQDAVNQAKASQTWGSLPSGIQKMIERALEPKVDWRQQLRRFIGDRIRLATVGSRKKRNRRFGWDFPGKKIVRGARLVVAMDTSGSIGDELLSQFLAEIDKIASQAEVIVMEVDADVQDVYQYRRGSLSADSFGGSKGKAVKGGGGTDFRPVWEALKNSQHRLLRDDVDGIIYLTDGYGSYPENDGGYPTLWVVTEESQLKTPPFGKTILLDRDFSRD